MSRCERRCEDEQMWRWADAREDVKMSRCEDEQMWEKMWRWSDVKMSRCERRCEDEQMWRWADVREHVKMSRCERRKCEDEKMFRRCEDEKMFYRPPLLEEPCAQTLSGKKLPVFRIEEILSCKSRLGFRKPFILSAKRPTSRIRPQIFPYNSWLPQDLLKARLRTRRPSTAIWCARLRRRHSEVTRFWDDSPSSRYLTLTKACHFCGPKFY